MTFNITIGKNCLCRVNSELQEAEMGKIAMNSEQLAEILNDAGCHDQTENGNERKADKGGNLK